MNNRPVLIAAFDMSCFRCGELISEGDIVRRDEHASWICLECMLREDRMAVEAQGEIPDHRYQITDLEVEWKDGM